MLLLQFVLLVGTALVWWFARRDLTRLGAQGRSGETEELERLRAGVQDLAADLERRAEAAELRLAARIAQASALAPTSSNPAPPELGAGGRSSAEPAEDDRFAPARALAAAGVTDPTEIARRTGLGRGEVELLLNLRARRAP